MPICCIVKGCRSRYAKNGASKRKFFRLPVKNKKRLKLWLKAMGQEGSKDLIPSRRICSDHFVSGEKSNNKNSPDYIPTLFEHTSMEERRRLKEQYHSFIKEVDKRREKIAATTSLLESLEEEFRDEDDNDDQALSCNDSNPHFEYQPDVQDILANYSRADQSTQTSKDSYMSSLEDEYYKLKDQLSVIRVKDMFRDMELSMFINNDVKVKCLTGLDSYAMLKVLSEYVSKYQGLQVLGKLTHIQQLMLTLIKIKLNLAMPFLAILFSVSVTTVSRIFKITIDILFFQVVPCLVFWPSNNVMRRLVPIQYIECENHLYSIDVFDIEIELRGSGTLCYKNYKDDMLDSFISNANVREKKYFICVAPQGLIIHISKGVWGGLGERIVALESGFLEKVSPGDVILSSRDFEIDDEVEAREADLKLCDPLSNDIEYEGIVACKTIIDTLKGRFQILEDRMTQTWVKDSERDDFATSDKIIHIACALMNMTNSDLNIENCFQDIGD